MAFTKSKVSNHVVGNLKKIYYTVDFDSVTEGKISTGLDQVRFASFGNKTTADSPGRIFLNQSDASTASAGDIFIDNVNSDDEGYVVVEGV